MKKILLFILLIGAQVQAQELFIPNQKAKEVVIGDLTHKIKVDLNEHTVLCLRGDYSATSFKIAIPAIDDITYLDHTSRGAPGPCINAGFCQMKEDEQFSWGSLTDFRFPIFHDLSRPTEDVQIRVIRKEVLALNGNVCSRFYVEELSSMIRGTLFHHQASMPLASGPAEMCD